jgi:hypothetical protein
MTKNDGTTFQNQNHMANQKAIRRSTSEMKKNPNNYKAASTCTILTLHASVIRKSAKYHKETGIFSNQHFTLE